MVTETFASFFDCEVISRREVGCSDVEIYGFCRDKLRRWEERLKTEPSCEMIDFEISYAREVMGEIEKKLEASGELHLIQAEKIDYPDTDTIIERLDKIEKEKEEEKNTFFDYEYSNKKESKKSQSRRNKRTTPDGEEIIPKWKEPFVQRGKEEILSPESIPGNFVKSNNYIRDMICAKLDYSHAYLYIVLLSFRNQKSNKTFPSLKRIASKMGISPRSISDKLVRLVDLGFLKVHSGTIGITNSYYFPLEDFYSKVDAKEKNLQDGARKLKRAKFRKKKDKGDKLL